MLRQRLTVLLTSGGLLASAICAQSTEAPSDEPPEAVFAEETSVTAPFRAEADSPITHTDLPVAEIDAAYFGQEPSLVLATSPSIIFSVDSGGVAGYSYFRLRGMDQTRVNMTLDGVPLNEPEDQGVYFSNYPDFLNSISSIQIQRGTGTSSLGVASYAGSILYESPASSSERREEVSASYGSDDTSRAYAELATPLGSRTTLYLRGSTLRSGGYKHHSGNDSNSFFYSLGWVNGPHVLRLTGFAGHQENQLAWLGVPRAELDRDFRANGNTSDETDRFTQALSTLRYSLALSSRTMVSSTFYANYLNGDYDFDLDNFLGAGPGTELYNYDFKSRFLGSFVTITHSQGGIEVSGGAHFNRYQRRHRGSERSAGPLYQNTGFRGEASAFVKINASVGLWLLFADLQLRKSYFDYSGSVSIPQLSWSFVNPRLGISRHIGDEVVAYYSLGRTGREPTRNDLFGGLDDLGAGADGEPLLLDIPAEFVLDHELGVRVQRSSWNASANLYWMEFSDEITLNGQFGPNGLPLNSNVAHSYRSGIELEARRALGRGITLVNATSWSRNRISDRGVEFEPVLSPDLVVNQGIELERSAFAVTLTARYQGSTWIDLANTTQLPSYLVLDGSVLIWLNRFRLELRALNLLDEQALSYGSVRADGVPILLVHPRRSLFLGLRWTS